MATDEHIQDLEPRPASLLLLELPYAQTRDVPIHHPYDIVTAATLEHLPQLARYEHLAWVSGRLSEASYGFSLSYLVEGTSYRFERIECGGFILRKHSAGVTLLRQVKREPIIPPSVQALPLAQQLGHVVEVLDDATSQVIRAIKQDLERAEQTQQTQDGQQYIFDGNVAEVLDHLVGPERAVVQMVDVWGTPIKFEVWTGEVDGGLYGLRIYVTIDPDRSDGATAVRLCVAWIRLDQPKALECKAELQYLPLAWPYQPGLRPMEWIELEAAWNDALHTSRSVVGQWWRSKLETWHAPAGEQTADNNAMRLSSINQEYRRKKVADAKALKLKNPRLSQKQIADQVEVNDRTLRSWVRDRRYN